MAFAHPWWLLAVPLAPAAGFISYKFLESRRAALAFPEAEAAASPGPWTRLARILPYALKAAALALAAAAMARPQLADRGGAAAGRGIDILLALDTSTSMLALDFDPLDRMAAAKETAKKFVQGRASDRIGLVVFGGAPIAACPLTSDYEALLEYLGGVEAGMTRAEGTAVGDGIAAAADRLRAGSAKSKVIILLTDGANNAGAVDPLTAAKAAASYGVKIYAVGTGRRGEAFIPVDTPFGRRLAKIPDELDEDALLRVAAETGGKYFRATNYKELSGIFSDIDRLEKTESRRPPVVSYRDLYPWLLLPAAGLLLMEMALARTLLLRVP